MTTPFRVLLSSAGRRVALLEIWRKTLASMGLEGEVWATDMSRLAPVFHVADRGIEVPRCTAPEFIPMMLELCESEQIRVIVPTIDTELPAYAEHRDAFEAVGTRVLISSPEVIEIAYRKDSTHAWLASQGFPIPRQTTVEDALSHREDWPFPLLTKPVAGSCSIGVAVVHNEGQLRAATADGDYIVQTLATGAEYTVSFLANREGRCLCAVPRKRLRVRGGEVEKGMAVRHPLVEELAFSVCERLPGAYGPMNVQIFHDPVDDALRIIEINPRFGGGFPLAWTAGADYPRWILEELLGRESTASADSWRDGLVMMRYDEAVYRHASEVGLE